MQWLPPLGALLIGLAFAQQPVINAAVARGLGSPIAAAVVSVSITLLCLLATLPFTGGTLRPAALAALPWWSVLGGMIGILIVAGSAALVPLTGAALFVVCLVGGQLLGAAVADHVGAFGLPERPLTAPRALGLALVALGAVLVQRG